MGFLRKREKLVESISFMGIFAGINAIFSLVGSFVDVLSIVSSIVLPLTSVLVALLVKKRYYPIYAIATIGVCIAISAWNFQNTLFYIIPSVIFGFIYALLWESKIPETLSLSILSLVETGLFILNLFILKKLWSMDIESFLLNLFGGKDNPNANVVFPLFCLAYSMAQTALSHLFICFNMSKMGLKKEEKSIGLLEPIVSFAFLIGLLITAFFSIKTAYFLFGIASLFAFFPLFETYHWKRPLFIILMVSFLFIGIITFSIIASKVSGEYILLFTGVFILGIDLSIFVDTLIEKKQRGK